MAKLEVPEAFKQAKKEADIIKIGRALSSGISGVGANDQLKKSLSATTPTQVNNLINRANTLVKKQSGNKGKKHVLFDEDPFKKKDTEFDWRDRLKQWKKMQQSSGAILDFVG